jgi:tripartite-type tricarboxylate transporter receptor subunit TctC
MDRRAFTYGSLFAATCLASFAPAAQADEAFYRGRTIDLIVGYPVGGANDNYARLLSRHMGRHIPGAPSLVIRNMPGAGSLQAANHVYNAAPRDGSVLAIAAPTIALDQKFGAQGVRFDARKLEWIGRANSQVALVILRAQVKASTPQDALREEIVMAGTGASSTISIYPGVMNRLLGYRFKFIMGYKGSGDAMLAVERGEVEGMNISWESLEANHPTWLPERKVKPLVQFAQARHPSLPNTPTVVELARNDEERRILDALMSTVEVGVSFFTTPETPAARVEALRRGFDKMAKDPACIEEAAKLRLPLQPRRGEDVAALVASLVDLPDDLTKKMKAVYSAE